MLALRQAGERASLMPPLVELAPAKINLALHVTGQRADGYHLLESVVTFAAIGDRLTFSSADKDQFTVSGRFSGPLLDNLHDNLVLRARDGLRARIDALEGPTPPVAIHLEKNLPVASGIGGGSADAAAALRGLLRFWGAKLPTEALAGLALSLGADVPMCLGGVAAIARGVGEDLHPLPDLPGLHIVFGNPLLGVSTPEVFAQLRSKQNPPLGDLGGNDWIDQLSRLRNDLEGPARELVPEIAEISAFIDAEGALLTRMSGSGATCFGIFATEDAAERAAARLQVLRPEWYFEAANTIAGSRP